MASRYCGFAGNSRLVRSNELGNRPGIVNQSEYRHFLLPKRPWQANDSCLTTDLMEDPSAGEEGSLVRVKNSHVPACWKQTHYHVWQLKYLETLYNGRWPRLIKPKHIRPS